MNILKDLWSRFWFREVGVRAVTDLWTEEGRKLEGLIPQGMMLFGELVGWVEGKTPIQQNYTYNVPEGERHLYIYRITQINPQGYQVDLGWDQVKEFCRNAGLRTVPELDRREKWELEKFTPTMDGGREYDGVSVYIDANFHNIHLDDFDGQYTEEPLPLSDPNSVDEGICIRAEGLRPVVLKAKSPIFLQHETKMLDKDTTDIEADASTEEEK